jgi:hypothetical protein
MRRLAATTGAHPHGQICDDVAALYSALDDVPASFALPGGPASVGRRIRAPPAHNGVAPLLLVVVPVRKESPTSAQMNARFSPEKVIEFRWNDR